MTGIDRLLKFKYGGNVSEGGKKQGDKDKGGQGHNAKSGNGGFGGKSGTGFSDAGYANRANTGYRPDTSRSPVRGGGGSIATGKGNATIADKKIMDRYLGNPDEHIPDERSYWDAVRNLGKAGVDYANMNQGFFDDPLGAIGRWIGRSFGVGEVNPSMQALGARIGNPNASWGIDPIGAALGIGGLGLVGTGAPGSIYGAGKHITGWNGPMLSFDGFHGSAGMNPGNVTSSSIGGIDTLGGGGREQRDNQDRGFGRQPTEQKVNNGPSNSSGNNNASNGTDNGQYPIGGRVNPYLDDITKYAFGPMWDWILYPGQEGFKDGGYPRHPAGEVTGPGGPKDDLVGPIALSNKEYVLPVEMIQHFGKGDYNKGIDALEIIRKKVIRK